MEYQEVFESGEVLSANQIVLPSRIINELMIESRHGGEGVLDLGVGAHFFNGVL